MQKRNQAVDAVEDVANDLRVSGERIAKDKVGVPRAQLLRRQQKVDEHENVDENEQAVAGKGPVVVEGQHNEEKEVDQKVKSGCF